MPLQPVLSGRYHDQFERVDGEWRWVERMVFPDLRATSAGTCGAARDRRIS